MKNSELIALKNELYAIPNITPYIKEEIEKIIDKHLLNSESKIDLHNFTPREFDVPRGGFNPPMSDRIFCASNGQK